MHRQELWQFNLGRFSLSVADYTGGGACWGWNKLGRGRFRLNLGNYGIRFERY